MADEIKIENSPSSTPRVRTYERDVAEFLKQEGGTAAQVALAEQERRVEIRDGVQETQIKPAPPLVPSPAAERTRREARSLVLWSILFVFCAGAVGIGYWFVTNLPVQPRVSTPTSASKQKIILADGEKALDTARLTRDTFITAFAREREAAQALSSFAVLTPTKFERDAEGAEAPRAQTTAEFLSLLEASARGDLVRVLAPEFVVGFRGLPENRAFLIFKTNYYQTALAGMLAWENTLQNDLGPLMGEGINGTHFADRTLHNRDVRELRDAHEQALLLWGFADKQTLIITTDSDTFEKVVARLVQTP